MTKLHGAIRDWYPRLRVSRPERLGAFALICLELVLLLLFVHNFEIENRQYFLWIFGIAAGGFLIHAWLPRPLRCWFFVCVSVGGLLFVLDLAEGLKVIGIGLGLIGVCHLPIPVLLRGAVLLIAGGVLAGLRIDYPKAPFWPVLASMFMFRLIVYLFELRHAKFRLPSALTLAYFFPLPNVSFWLFPVLDFQTFRATYYDEDDYKIYQSGIAWIVRGLSHLVAYRLIKYYLLPAPYELRDVAHIVLYVAGTYALYLWVSGCFHIVTGMLHLYGFNVPRTHQNYFLASSLSDIWRRINIYWKDFMTKVFFFPAFFAMRRFGTRTAMVGATLVVFVATWLLHSYQMFWLVGDLPLSANVAALWLGAGALVALSLQFEVRQQTGRERAGRVSGRSFELGPAVVLSLRTLGTFTLVSLFWAAWTDPGFLKSSHFPLRTLDSLAGGVAALVGIIVAVVAAGVVAHWIYQSCRERLPAFADSFPGSVGVQAAVLGLLLIVGTPQVAGVFGSSAREMAVTLRQDNPTMLEAGQAMRGYYEEIAVTHLQAGPFLRKLTMGDLAPPDVGHYRDATQPTDDLLLGHELKPGWEGKLGVATATINDLGMRDRASLTVRKPANTCRIALVGSSVVMGYGVENAEVFARLLEEKFNSSLAAGSPRLELLNFGTGRSMAINRVRLIEKKVLGFGPDAIYYFAHQDELHSAGQFMAGIVWYARQKKLTIPYAYMTEIVQKSGVTDGTPSEALERIFTPYAREVILGLYRVLVEDCRQRGVVPVWIYLPMPGIAQTPADAGDVVALAQEAGFKVINLSDWAKAYSPGDVKLSPDDHHPNAQGHRVIAERLFADVRKRPELLPDCVRLQPGVR